MFVGGAINSGGGVVVSGETAIRVFFVFFLWGRAGGRSLSDDSAGPPVQHFSTRRRRSERVEVGTEGRRVGGRGGGRERGTAPYGKSCKAFSSS